MTQTDKYLWTSPMTLTTWTTLVSLSTLIRISTVTVTTTWTPSSTLILIQTGDSMTLPILTTIASYASTSTQLGILSLCGNITKLREPTKTLSHGLPACWDKTPELSPMPTWDNTSVELVSQQWQFQPSQSQPSLSQPLLLLLPQLWDLPLFLDLPQYQ